jgi:ankyrin repeat protein
MKSRNKNKSNNKKKAQRKTPIAPAATPVSPADALAILQQATPNLTVFQVVNEDQMAHLIKTRQSIENVILTPTKPNTTISMKLTGAAILGQRSDVQKFLELGADPNCALGDGNGNTPLIGAAECSHARNLEDIEKREQIYAEYRLIVWLLIKHGADVNLCNQVGMSPLNVAAELSDLKMVALLIKLGANIDVVDSVNQLTALGNAAAHNRTDIMTLLIEHGACVNAVSPDARSPIYLAAHNGHLDAVRLLLQKGAKADELTPKMNSSSLFTAMSRKHDAVVSALLEAGADPNQTFADGDSALLIATNYAHLPTIRLLLEHGAKPDMLSEDGTSALYFAGLIYRVDIMELLIQFGATVNLHCKSTGSSALHFALYNGRLEIAALLLAHGALIDDRRDEDGATPLSLAIIGGNPDSVAFALQHGADVNLEINTHAQPLAYALIMKEYSPEITRLLIQHILKSSPLERSCLSGVAARLCKAGNATPLLLLINALLEQNVPGRTILNLLPVVSSSDKTNAMNHPDFVGTLDLMRRKYMPNVRFINLENERGSPPAVKNLDRAVSYVAQKISKLSLGFFQEQSKNSNEAPTMKNRM